jgi:3'-phosphoadenosine 5'-phosphosulfate sulfotransferase (PAPS reductase)/FAD synthetase
LKHGTGGVSNMNNEYKSRVYTDRPAYADFEAPRKFEAIKSIIAKRLKQYPNAICSYSGGSDSDIMIHLIETVRKIFWLPPVHYVFFNTGLEMEATKRHVNETANLYGVEIAVERPVKGIVQSTRENGIPFISKIVSSGLEGVQKKNIPLSIAEEYAKADDKQAKRAELKKRFPKCESQINFLCGCNSAGDPRPDIQLVIGSSKYLLDFIKENPIPFRVSNKCCDHCKKQLAHRVQKGFDMVITGERRGEGGMRSVPRKDNTSMCFAETADGKFRLRPLFYVTDADKAWYKNYHKIKYSDAYEVYGLARTGCCGCSISAKAVEDLEKIRPYEPNLVKAAWNVFGESYKYRQKYNEYKKTKMKQDSIAASIEPPMEGQISLFSEEVIE